MPTSMDVAPYNIQTEHFEVDQYVRVQLSNGRSEIGVVVEIDEPAGVAVIATRHGYEITVRFSSVRRAFLLVLDLNGVLVARGRGSFIDRPGVEEFISFVMNNFVVAVWTSGLERTSNPIIDKVFDGYQDRLLFKLYRDSCTVLPTPDKPYRTIKNLQRIFDTYPKSFHAVNTIIVDDSPDKCSHPDIALCPVPFNDPVKQVDDNGLALAMEVLREVLRVESNAPLIRSSEERLLAIAAQEERARMEMEKQKKLASHEAEEELKDTLKTQAAKSVGLPETLLWTTRLCCEHISGGCSREDCRFSHDLDDGKRPCSRKGFCSRGHSHRWTEDPHSKAESTPLNSSSKGSNILASFDVSNIVSFFSTNPDLQKQTQRDEGCLEGGRPNQEWERIKQQLQQQEEAWQQQQQQQHQQQQQQQQKQRQQHRRQKEKRNGGGQRGRNTTSGDQKNTVHGTSNMTQSSWTYRETLHTDSATDCMAPGRVSVRLSGDSQDGFALLRQLEASLSQVKTEGKEKTGGRSNRRKRIQ